MKAITLLQPWATLVAIGVKRFETRSWQTDYRGPLAIHASARFPRAARALCETAAFRYALRRVKQPLPRGCVVATCQLVSTRRVEEFFDPKLIEMPRAVCAEMLADLHFGDFSTGRFAWGLAEVCALPVPIPAKGVLSLWEWDGGPSQL